MVVRCPTEPVVPYPVEQQPLMQPPTLTATAAVTTPRHPMQKPPTPPSSTTDARRSITPPTASGEPTPPPARSSSSSTSSHPAKPMNNVSPTPSPLESQRVTALLDLNRVLLREVIALQISGRAGNPGQAPSPPQPEAKTDGDGSAGGAGAAAAPPRQPMSGKMSFSKEYIEFVSPLPSEMIHPLLFVLFFRPSLCRFSLSSSILTSLMMRSDRYMRRLQSNLSYLAAIAERHTKPQNVLPYPAIMECPPGSEGDEVKETIREMYIRLRELWPEYKGK